MFVIKGNLRKSLSSLVTLSIGLLVFVSIPSQIDVFDTSNGGVNARTLPYIISSAIIILSLLIIVFNTIGVQMEEADPTDGEQSKATSYGRVFLACIAIALWIVLLPYLGFSIATMLLVASVMLIIGSCRWWQIVILSLILSFPVNYLLALVMGVYLPNGSLFG